MKKNPLRHHEEEPDWKQNPLLGDAEIPDLLSEQLMSNLELCFTFPPQKSSIFSLKSHVGLK